MKNKIPHKRRFVDSVIMVMHQRAFYENSRCLFVMGPSKFLGKNVSMFTFSHFQVLKIND